MKKQTLAEIEEQTFYDEDFDQIPPNDIVAYNELRSCADLFRLKEQKTLNIQPEFQRDIVWPIGVIYSSGHAASSKSGIFIL